MHNNNPYANAPPVQQQPQKSLEDEYAEAKENAKTCPYEKLPDLDNFLRLARSRQEEGITYLKKNIEQIDEVRQIIAERKARGR